MTNQSNNGLLENAGLMALFALIVDQRMFKAAQSIKPCRIDAVKIVVPSVLAQRLELSWKDLKLVFNHG